MGPLSASLGAALTSTLVAHLARLDLAKQPKKVSAPQFLQGFVAPRRHQWRSVTSAISSELKRAKDVMNSSQEPLRTVFQGPQGHP